MFKSDLPICRSSDSAPELLSGMKLGWVKMQVVTEEGIVMRWLTSFKYVECKKNIFA